MQSFCPEELAVYKDYVAIIDKELYAFLTRFQDPYYDYLLYHFGYKPLEGMTSSQNGKRPLLGKRLRPLMCLLVCKGLTGDYKKALPLILSTEVLHNASLIHDDIQDQDEVRWGRPTLWKLFGIGQGINCGDTLQALAYGLILELYENGFSHDVVRKVLSISNRVHRTVVEGQYLDLLFETRTDIQEYEYLEMISKKTAAPYAGAAECAAVLSLPEKEWDRIPFFSDFGLKFGMLFQLTDDILGIWGGLEKTGKIPADIRSKKKTLPIVYAFNNANAKERNKLLSIYARTGPLDEKQEAPLIFELLEKLGTYEACKKWIAKFYDETLLALSKTDIPNLYQEELRHMVDYCFNRANF
jgi:geranylgeranyl diphosphate synthase type I